MQIKASVNYHMNSQQPRALHIDADGEKGKVLIPDLMPAEVRVKDCRSSSSENNFAVNFSQDSVSFVYSESVINDFSAFGESKQNDSELRKSESESEKIYNQELSDLLSKHIDAKEVITFDHTVRIDDPESERRPVRHVHTDYSKEGAHKRLRDILGDEKAVVWEKGRFGFVNVWRPIQNVVLNSPLGFVRPQSVTAGCS